jgi:Protein of unknown function (DUF3093)
VRTFDERLTPPWWLWVIGEGLVAVLAFSFYVAVGPAPGAAVVLVFGGALAWVLVTAAARVSVEGETLTAGPAHIPVSALGPVVVLDADHARAVRGPESDPAAYHLIRGWVPAGVKAAVVDPNDSTPYWFVATRRPAALAAAIESARQLRGGGGQL